MYYEVLTPDSLIYFWILFFTFVKWDGQNMWHVWWRGEVQIRFWWGNLGGRDNMVRPMHRWGSIIIMSFKFVWRSWIGMIWLRMGTSEHCNEPWGSKKLGNFLTRWTKLFKEDWMSACYCWGCFQIRNVIHTCSGYGFIFIWMGGGEE